MPSSVDAMAKHGCGGRADGGGGSGAGRQRRSSQRWQNECVTMPKRLARSVLCVGRRRRRHHYPTSIHKACNRLWMLWRSMVVVVEPMVMAGPETVNIDMFITSERIEGIS